MEKYTKAFAAIHWIHAIMISFVLIGATLTLPHLPKTAGDLLPFKGHIIFGVVVTVVTLLRLWILKSQPELKALKISTFREMLVRWNHRLIYLFLILVGISGIATAKSANVGQVVVFGEDPSVYTGPDGITAIFASVHDVSTTILMVLIVVHVLGVISYMMKSKENILKRVWF